MRRLCTGYMTQIISREAMSDLLQLCSLVLKLPTTHHISGEMYMICPCPVPLSESPVLQKKQAPHYGVCPPPPDVKATGELGKVTA